MVRTVQNPLPSRGGGVTMDRQELAKASPQAWRAFVRAQAAAWSDRATDADRSAYGRAKAELERIELSACNVLGKTARHANLENLVR